AHVAELGGEEDLVAAVLDCPAHQLLIPADAVHVGGVQEGHSAVECVVDRRDRFIVAARAIEFAHAHAAEADRRDFGTILAEAALGDLKHVLLPFCQLPSRRRTSAASNGSSTRL